MNELKEKIEELRKKLKTMDWKEFIAVQVITVFAGIVLVTGSVMGIAEIINQTDVPEHTSSRWGPPEYSTSQAGVLTGKNKSGDIGTWQDDLGNSKSPAVRESQYHGSEGADSVYSTPPIYAPTPSYDMKKNSADDYLNESTDDNSSRNVNSRSIPASLVD